MEPIVRDHGFELVDVDQRRGRAPWAVRVIVDTESGDGRVGVDACARLSREIGTHLDAGDVIPSRYNLEVSSPGLDRVLSREKDFQAAIGSRIKLDTRTPIDGRKRFTGVLVSFVGDVACLEVDDGEVEVPFADVSRANRIYEFTRDDFAAQA
ncbi:MAG: ribosome maturation factor RimP [Myxococcota bacterium]|nr:ribosome maturation factor RimP [Myxococcota bacterium]